MFKHYLCVVSFVILTAEISCRNSTVFHTQSLYARASKSDLRKQQKLISFTSDGDLRIELDFNVPFITVPIKKSMDMAKSSMINFNVGALALTGVVLFGSVIAFPVLLAFFNKDGVIPASNPITMLYSKKERQRRDDSNLLWKYLTAIENSLLENDIDVTSCSQRIMCWTVKNSSQKVAEGEGSSTDKIVDGIASSKWFQKSLLNSKFQEAVQYGLEGRKCTSIYGKCKINHESMYYFVKYFIDSFNSG